MAATRSFVGMCSPSAETAMPLISAQKQFPASQYYPTRRLIAVILVIVQKARDLSLRRDGLRAIGEGGRLVEEFPLDFGRETAPSQDDGRSQTFQNFLVLAESPINLQTCRRLSSRLC